MEKINEQLLLKLGFEKRNDEDGVFYGLNEIYLDDKFRLSTLDGSGYCWLTIGEPIETKTELMYLYKILTKEDLIEV